LTKVFLIRHGETLWNKERKYQGHTNIPLSAEGIQQAGAVAAQLAGEKLAGVYASDLDRAFITAQIIAQPHHIPVVGMPELREVGFGQWEGLTYNAIHDRWPEEMGKLYTHPGEIVIPGGESFAQLQQRAVQAMDVLVQKHPEETIVVVSHGGTIRTLLCEVLGVELNNIWNIRQDNAAINVIEYYEHKTIIALVNDCHQLKR
jgi:alpha-ribazole phosphatase